jgi:hypothetical protein
MQDDSEENTPAISCKQSYMFMPHNKSKNSIVTDGNPPQELCIEALPKSVYLNSNKEDRNIQKLKDDYIRNQFDHQNFNSFLTSKLGQHYFLGIHTKAMEKEIEEI